MSRHLKAFAVLATNVLALFGGIYAADFVDRQFSYAIGFGVGVLTVWCARAYARLLHP